MDRPDVTEPVIEAVLPDGAYEAIVVDATEVADGVVAVEVTLLDGAHKGTLVAVRAAGLGVAALDLLAAPCVLVVADGNPRVILDAV